MSISGTGPGNSGAPFRTFQSSPIKLAGAAGVALSEKITTAVRESEDKFMSMQAAELKKRAAFYERFNGKIGDDAFADLNAQASRMLAQLLDRRV